MQDVEQLPRELEDTLAGLSPKASCRQKRLGDAGAFPAKTYWITETTRKHEKGSKT